MAPVGNQGDGAPSRKFCRAAVRVLYNSTGSRYNKGAPGQSSEGRRRGSPIQCVQSGAQAGAACANAHQTRASRSNGRWRQQRPSHGRRRLQARRRRCASGKFRQGSWRNGAMRCVCCAWHRAIDRMGEEPRPCRTSRRGRIAVARGDFLAAADASSFESALRGRPCRREDDCATPARACWDGAIFGARHREGRACDVI